MHCGKFVHLHLLSKHLCFLTKPFAVICHSGPHPHDETMPQGRAKSLKPKRITESIKENQGQEKETERENILTNIRPNWDLTQSVSMSRICIYMMMISINMSLCVFDMFLRFSSITPPECVWVCFEYWFAAFCFQGLLIKIQKNKDNVHFVCS